MAKPKFKFYWVLLVLLALIYEGICANPVSHWQLRSPLPGGYEFYGVAFGNGKFVAVSYGPIFTSTNGADWYTPTNGPQSYLHIAFGNGVFVATPWHWTSTIAVSQDGVNWTSLPMPISIEGIGFCNGAFVGGGYNFSKSTIDFFVSTDGTNWTQCASVPASVTEVSQISYGGGRYLASAGNIYVSTNLTDWSVSNTSSDSISSICYGNGLYVAVGDYSGAYISNDATHWTNYGSSDLFLSQIIFARGSFVAVGQHPVQEMISTNATNWVNVALPEQGQNGNVDYNGLAYANGVLVAVGSSGQVSTSTDFTNWTSQFRGTIQDLYGVAYVSNAWIAVGNLQETITSTNGADWLQQYAYFPEIYTSVCQAKGLTAITVDYEGYGFVLVTSNFVSWTGSTALTEPALYGVSYGSNEWVAVGGYGTIWTSVTATNWNIITTVTSNDLYGITYVQNKFVAVGMAGTTVSSTNGTVWTASSSGTTSDLNDVTYGQGYFLAVGVNGTVTTSVDGIHWKPRGFISAETLCGVAYGDGYFVAVGIDGDIFTSPDSFTWTIQNSPVNWQLSHIAYGNHSFVAVGLGGIIVHSDPFINLSVMPSNFPTLNITGPIGSTVSIQTTSNLYTMSQWTNAAIVPITNQPTIWKDTLPHSGSSRYYRAVFLQ